MIDKDVFTHIIAAASPFHIKCMIDSDINIVSRTLENLSTAVLLFDDQLCLRYLNLAAEMLLAISKRHAVGLLLDDLLPHNRSFCIRLNKALATGFSFTECEIVLLLSGARSATVCCMVTPVLDRNTSRELLVELVREDRHLRILREGVLFTQNTATRALIRGLAHEIKNPLGGLRGAAQLLERELSDNILKEYTRIIIGEADRLQDLLNQMLGPNTLPRKRAINIHEVLERVHTLVKSEVCQGIQLHIDYDPSIPSVIVDPDQMIQVFLNLVRNAAQALGERGNITLRTRVRRQFTIAGQRHRLVLNVDVIDNGPGVPDELLPYIFLPMVTGRTNGVGLGLPIAQSLINQNGGFIECVSQPGETIFSLFLPLSNNDFQKIQQVAQDDGSKARTCLDH
ncbi:sensory histidine kinase NtrB [Gammaproteobacteria bacterium]